MMLKKLRRHWTARWFAWACTAITALLPLMPSPAGAAAPGQPVRRGGNAYTNDANGNTLTGGGRTNTWDSQNRLVQCAFNGTTTTNTYAADGLRHRSVVGANTTDTILDQTMQVRELLNGAVKATYLVGPRGPEYRRDDQAGTIRWYVYDGLGSVVGEVAPDGTLTRSQTFDVYGAVRTSTGTATTKQKFVGSLGHPSDDETGLIYMRARHYDPVCGRFVSEDPAKHGSNWFAYAHSNPTCAGDRTGRDDFSLVGISATTDIGTAMDSIGTGLEMLDGEVTTDLVGSVTDLGPPNPEFAFWLRQRGLDPNEFVYAAKEIAHAGGQVLKAWLRTNLQTGEYIAYLDSDTAFLSHVTPYVGTLF